MKVSSDVRKSLQEKKKRKVFVFIFIREKWKFQKILGRQSHILLLSLKSF